MASTSTESQSADLDLNSLKKGEVYADHFKKGDYHCVKCNTAIFNSSKKLKLQSPQSKFPCFEFPISKALIRPVDDFSYGLIRLKIVCKQCGSALGHAFPENQTKDMYCVYSEAFTFVPSGEDGEEFIDKIAEQARAAEESNADDSDSDVVGDAAAATSAPTPGGPITNSSVSLLKVPSFKLWKVLPIVLLSIPAVFIALKVYRTRQQ